MSTQNFYTELPLCDVSLSELLGAPANFTKIPDDWHVIISDIKDSTKAIAQGRHEAINLIATGSIIAVLNIARKNHLEIPFFFGGDGSTLLVPEVIMSSAIGHLKIHKRNTFQNFGLDLRVGSIPVYEIYAEKFRLAIAKLGVDTGYSIPIISGNGLNYAEQLIKKEDYIYPEESALAEDIDLTGMECRWDRIKPTNETNEVVSLLVISEDEKAGNTSFKKVIDSIDQIYGPRHERNPVSRHQLKLKPSLRRLGAESKVRFGQMKWTHVFRALLETIYGKLIYFRFDRHGKQYLNRLVALSDTLVLDGKVNTVISGTLEQRQLLTLILDKMEENGEIVYGLQVSQESVMSCYVRDHIDHHIHFVDGADGGYTNAAKQLKDKLKRKEKGPAG